MAFTLVSGRTDANSSLDFSARNLGGGVRVVGGNLEASTGNYATNGLVPTPTFASLDPFGNREPDFVYFECRDGYSFVHNWITGAIKLLAISTGGTGDVNLALTEWTDATALDAAVGNDVAFLAFWFPAWDNS